MLTKQTFVIASTVVALIMVVVVNYIRIKNTNKPVIGRKIILPPFFMATGALMYLHPYFRLTWKEAVSAIIIGLLFSILLIKTSRFEVRDGFIYMKRSKLFLVVLIGLVAFRMIGKVILAETIKIEPGQMAGLFFLLAFSMLLPWRIGTYVMYRKLERSLES